MKAKLNNGIDKATSLVVRLSVYDSPIRGKEMGGPYCMDLRSIQDRGPLLKSQQERRMLIVLCLFYFFQK